MNVVSVMAHQDDEMRCLGTMLRCRDRGDRLHFICLTDGSKGLVDRSEAPRNEAAQVRREEMSDLCDALDASYRCLGEPDEYLVDYPPVRDALIDALRIVGADLVFTHYHEDYNADRVLTHYIVRHCAMQAALPVIGSEKPLAAPPVLLLWGPQPLNRAAFLPCPVASRSRTAVRPPAARRHHPSRRPRRRPNDRPGRKSRFVSRHPPAGV